MQKVLNFNTGVSVFFSSGSLLKICVPLNAKNFLPASDLIFSKDMFFVLLRVDLQWLVLTKEFYKLPLSNEQPVKKQ